MAKKIIIYNINDYFGGPLVLSALCKTFRDLGYDARVLFTYALQHEPGAEWGCPEYVIKHLIKAWISHYIHKICKKFQPF